MSKKNEAIMITRRELLKKSALLALGSGFIGARPIRLQSEEWEYPNPQLLVGPDQLSSRLGRSADIRVVDFRSTIKYWEGHIEDAVHLWKDDVVQKRNGIPNQVPPEGFIGGVFGSAGIGNQTRVVTYGDNGNIWSSRLFWTLDYYGHQETGLLNGGLNYWKASDKQLTTDPPNLPPEEFNATPDPQKIADSRWILDHLDDPEVQILDTRSPEEYTGEKILPNTERGGHIPGAIPVEWKEAIDWKTQTFKPYPELERIYKEAGLKKGNTIVTYCQTGIRAAHGYFTLRLLGYPKVRMYDGSWFEWSNNEDLPVKTGSA